MRFRAIADLACVFAGLAVLFQAAPAAADGAFPASDAVLLPADRPQQILLATNFGLIITDDGGATWQWTCERPQISGALSYQVGAPPGDRLYARASPGLAISDDGSCSWRLTGGAFATALVSDYFRDPTNAAHVLAIARTIDDAGIPAGPAVYESNDGGDSFGATPIYVAAAGDELLGVEIARPDPRVIYLALATSGSHPRIARSDDAGAGWMTFDVESSIGVGMARIIAVDPADARVIYLRVSSNSGEKLAVSRDGGMTFATPVTLPGALTAFARLASGTVLVAGLVAADGGTTTVGVAWRSTDGGVTFGDWTLSPQPRLQALAERDGMLYLAGDNFMDGWALAVSSDEGLSLQPLVRYDQVSAVKACAAAACQDSCDEQAGRKIWAPEVCNPLPADAGVDAAVDGGQPAKPASGCGCSAAAPGGAVGVAVLGVALITGLGSAARRRRRGSCPSSPGPPPASR
jgi:hypothetical protein